MFILIWVLVNKKMGGFQTDLALGIECNLGIIFKPHKNLNNSMS